MAAPPAQVIRELLPRPELRSHLAAIRIQLVDATSAPYLHRTNPNGCAEIVWRPGQPALVVGPQSGPAEELIEPDTWIVGVRLQPGAIPAVLGVPATHLVDQRIRLDDVWTPHAARSLHPVHDCATPAAVATTLQTSLGHRRDGDLDPVVREMMHELLSTRAQAITAVANKLGISMRHLRRRVEAAVGLTPKQLHRVLRFQIFLALTRRHPNPHGHLADLAAQAGYADHAHLSREFRWACDAAVSSRLTYAEVCAALAAAERNNDLDTRGLTVALGTWDDVWDATRPVELTADVERRAGELASRHALRGADVVHLSSALALESADLIVAVWDRRLRAGVTAEQLAVAPAALPQ